MKHVRRIRTTARTRIPELREAMRFFDMVARSPGLRVRIGKLQAAGAAPRLRVIAASCGCRCGDAALQQAFRLDWQMRQRRFAAARAEKPLMRRTARARRAPSRS